MIITAWALLCLAATAGLFMVARAWYAKRILETYELGLKMGTLRVQMGQEWLDEQLRAAGVDPEQVRKLSS